MVKCVQDLSIETNISSRILALEEALTPGKTNEIGVISWNQFNKLANACHIIRESALVRASRWLCSVGSMTHFNNNGQDLVIIRPQWIYQSITSLISNKEYLKDGIFSHSSLERIWNLSSGELAFQLLALMETFHVAIPMPRDPTLVEQKSIIRHLLLDQTPPLSGKETLTHKRIFTFSYLPHGLFGRFMIW